MNNNQQTVSFHRRYHAYTGGHQKVRDYMAHVLSAKNFAPLLYLENKSPIQQQLFSDIANVKYQTHYQPNQADIVFLAGMDWNDYLPHFSEEKLKVNLIQHVRHADKSHPLFKFLQYKAIRLCVSEAVKEAIEPFANGPCISIKMGHVIPEIRVSKEYDLYILGTKQVELAKQITRWALSKGLKVLLHDTPQEKQQVHLAMAQSKVAIVLPNKTEGFYLPGIEAMALADWAVVPDCVASREYSLHKANITQCVLNFEECIAAIELSLTKVNQWNMFYKRWQGQRLASSYQLGTEREKFIGIMNSIEQLW